MFLVYGCISSMIWGLGHDRRTASAKQELSLSIPQAAKSVEVSLSVCTYQHGKWVERGLIDDSWVKDRAEWYNISACGISVLKEFEPSFADEQYVFVPNSCPPLRSDENFLISKVSNTRIAFVGDSLSRNQYVSFLCLLSNVEWFDITPPPAGYDHMRHYPNINATVGILWSVFLVRPSFQTRKASPSHPEPLPIYSKIKMDLSSLDESVVSAAKGSTHVVMNSGGWWGEPHRRAVFEQSMSIVLQQLRAFNETKIYLQYSGFPSTDKEGMCGRGILPVNSTTLLPQDAILGEGARTLFELARTYDHVHILHTVELSALRVDNHPGFIGSRLDCQHWRLPGVPDTWNLIMLNYHTWEN